MQENINKFNNIDSSKTNYKPKIVIFGVGGAGGNAINNMIESDLKGVEFIAANTDAQSLENSLATNKIQLGADLTKGLGAGSYPNKGREAAEENIEEINRYLDGANMVFISAGMGGGTGTGAAPVIAKLAREKNILTVGVVTKPFYFEGSHRMEVAEEGVEELKKYVDTLIVIPNQNLFRVANDQTTFESAFKMADAVLHAGVRGITDLITMPGLVNLDFADIRTVMTKMGKAMMGTGEASGENRAVVACEEAISNPLLDDVSIKGAKGVLVNMTGGSDMTLFEADAAVSAIKKEVDPRANIIFGSAFDENMKGNIRVSVVATGIDHNFIADYNNMVDDVNINKIEDQVSLSNKDFIDERKNSEENEEENQYQNSIESVSEYENEIIDEQDYDSREVIEDSESLYMQVSHEDRSDNNQYRSDTILSKETFFQKTNQEKIKSEQVSNPIKNQNQNFEQDKKVKSETSGFSLFSFMNSKKNKNSGNNYKDDTAGQNQNRQNSSEYQVGQSSPKYDNSLNREAQKNSSKSFFDSKFMNDNDHVTSKIDDDVLNVPAFFRKKK